MQVGCNALLSPVSRGVRQGGVLSPILFTVYMDDLLLSRLVLVATGMATLLGLSVMQMTLPFCTLSVSSLSYVASL